MHPAEDWKSEQMARAERALDDAVDQAYAAMHAADAVFEEIAVNEQRRAEEWAEKWREYAHREDVAPAWRDVIEKVERGELSWGDIASGGAADDPAVRAAIAADQQLRQRETARRRPARDEDTYFDEFTVLRKRRPRR